MLEGLHHVRFLSHYFLTGTGELEEKHCEDFAVERMFSMKGDKIHVKFFTKEEERRQGE